MFSSLSKISQQTWCEIRAGSTRDRRLDSGCSFNASGDAHGRVFKTAAGSATLRR
jgi:hypothetical protein